MAELRAGLQEVGLEEVRSYIQSGNVVFCSGGEARELAERIASVVDAQRGFRPEVMVLSRAALLEAVENDPFVDVEGRDKTVHYFFLGAAAKLNEDAARAKAGANERYSLAGRVFYLHAPDGLGRSKIAAGAERILGVPTTARNARTVGKLVELARI